MCLPIDSCFGFGTPQTDDYDHYHVPASKPPPAPASISRGLQLPAHHNGGHHYNGNGGHHYNGNGGHHYNGNSYPTYAGAEADRKASNDVMKRGTAHHAAEAAAAAHRGWHGHAATTGAQEKMAATAYPHPSADGTLKQNPAASNARVVAAAADGARGGAPHNNYYYCEPAHKDDAADSYYPAATATADHERY